MDKRELYIQKLREELLIENYSTRTVEEYTDYIRYFFNWLKLNKKKLVPKDVTKEDMNELKIASRTNCD